MPPEIDENRLEELDNEISFIISCLYQRGDDKMAETLSIDVQELFKYVRQWNDYWNEPSHI